MRRGSAAANGSFLFSGCKQIVIRCTHPERSLHGALWKIFGSSVSIGVDFRRAASANDDGRESSRRGKRSCPQGGGHHSKNLPRTRFLPRPECAGAIPQQWRGAFCRRSLCSRGNGG